jgi:hypothetical protein
MRILGAVDAASMENQGIVTVDGSLTAAELDNKLGATMDIYGSADVTSSSNAGTVNVYPGAQMTGNIEEARYYQLCIVVNGQSTKTVKAKDYVSFSVKALPEGTDIHLNVSWLSYDKARGIVSGYVPDTVGTYTVKMNASLDREGTIYDAEEVTLKIIVEPDTSGSVLDKASIAKIVLIIVVFIGLIFFISRYILRLA